eukprot:gnl/TRDRNA2_/TRDRNA2_37597_c0_seq1.p1 gnl/TRDRNA2_/TRDRNA2_37597_c0~~gnl/TRDRNA2_/TRDRNA2_37597_c0_seq1.p1  ORF type:complete len:579 (-),score=119.88 gnl/TRDRNA2_/TRDRNA2_37597_c0_seq1:104-1840(-)
MQDSNTQQQTRVIRFLGLAFGSCLLAGFAAVVVLVVGARGFSKELHTLPEEEDHGPSGVLLKQLRHLSEDENGGADPKQELVLRKSLGHIYHDQGRYAAAVEQYDRAHDLAIGLGGDEQLLAVLLARGLSRRHQGHLTQARKDLDAALILGRRPDADFEQTIAVLREAGNVERDFGHLQDALQFYQQAEQLANVELKHTTSGTHDGAGPREARRALAAVSADIGEVYVCKGKAQDALPLLMKSLERSKSDRSSEQGLLRASSPEDLELAKWRSRLAGAQHMNGDARHAMESFQRALRTQEKELRPGHPDLVTTRRGIASTQRDLGDATGALATIEAVEAALRAGPGVPEGPELSRTLLFKAELLREANQLTLAQAALDEALQRQADCFRPEDVNPEVAVGLKYKGSLLQDFGKLEEALKTYLTALEVITQTSGSQHLETAEIHNNLGTLYQQAGDLKTARSHFEKCLEIQLAVAGPKGHLSDQTAIAISYNNVATVLFQLGELEDAAKLLSKALAVQIETGLPENNPERVNMRENLKAVLKKLGRPLVGDVEGLEVSMMKEAKEGSNRKRPTHVPLAV